MGRKYFMYGILIPIKLIENELFVKAIESSKYNITNKIYNNLNGSFVIVGKKMYCDEDMIVPEISDSIKIVVEAHIDAILSEFKIEKNNTYHYYFIIEESCQ